MIHLDYDCPSLTFDSISLPLSFSRCVHASNRLSNRAQREVDAIKEDLFGFEWACGILAIGILFSICFWLTVAVNDCACPFSVYHEFGNPWLIELTEAAEKKFYADGTTNALPRLCSSVPLIELGFPRLTEFGIDSVAGGTCTLRMISSIASNPSADKTAD